MNIESTRSFKSIEREFGIEKANSLYGFVKDMSALTASQIVTEKMENLATKENLSDATNSLKLAIGAVASTAKVDLLNVRDELKDANSASTLSTKVEFSDVRKSIEDLRADMKEGFSAIRSDFKESFADLRLLQQRDNNTNLRWTMLLWASQLVGLAGVIKFLVQK